jgi:predicted SAM-dependent methyltransferase
LQANLIDAGYECHNTTDEIVNSSIDFIYSLNVLEHIENDAYVSQQLFRILKPGRNCLIYVPALQILFTSMDKKVGHLRRYNLKTIKNIMQNTGFIVEEAKYADCLGFFATLVYKYFGNDDGSLNIKMLKIYDRIIFPISRYLDLLCHPFFGKNLYILVRKPIGN